MTADDYLFYWFFQAMEPMESAPVILWTNGGPGCTSMEGAATEIGPLILDGVKRSPFFSGKLSYNKYAWNRRAHVLIVDQPRYVGFSTGRGPFVNSSAQAALDMVQFLRGWQGYFPEIDARFVLAGESYAGHFVPAWAKAIAEYNQDLRNVPAIRVAGIALSSACIDDSIQGLDTFLVYSKQMGLLPADAAPANMWEARQMMTNYLHYRPNTYDHTIPDVGPACATYGYNYTNFSNWFSREEVLEALHICGTAGQDTFSGCAGGCITLPNGFDHTPFAYTETLQEMLDLGIPVLLMYGMKDLTCDYVGLGLSVVPQYAGSSYVTICRHAYKVVTPSRALYDGAGSRTLPARPCKPSIPLGRSSQEEVGLSEPAG